AVLPRGQKGAEDGGGWFDPLAAVRALGDKITSSLTSKFPNAGYMLDASIGLAKQGFDSMLDWAQSKVSLFNDGGEGGASEASGDRSEEHTSELQSRFDLVCRLLLEKKN